MKTSELRNLIREEVRKVIKEATEDVYVKVSSPDIDVESNLKMFTFIKNPKLSTKTGTFTRDFIHGTLDINEFAKFATSKKMRVNLDKKNQYIHLVQPKTLVEIDMYPDKTTTFPELEAALTGQVTMYQR